jgi:hypothetical protein
MASNTVMIFMAIYLLDDNSGALERDVAVPQPSLADGRCALGSGANNRHCHAADRPGREDR